MMFIKTDKRTNDGIDSENHFDSKHLEMKNQYSITCAFAVTVFSYFYSY